MEGQTGPEVGWPEELAQEDDYEYRMQWDVDRVDLDFKTVAELESLLAERGLRLDYQLFRETDQVDAELREELHQWAETELSPSTEDLGSGRFISSLAFLLAFSCS